MHGTGPRRSAQFVRRHAQQIEVLAFVLPTGRQSAGDVVDRPQNGDDWCRVDGNITGLVVERHVSARDRDAQFEAAIRESFDGTSKLPHHLRVFGRTEIQAIADREGRRTTGRDVAIRLDEGQLRANVRVKLAITSVRVGRECNPESAHFVDSNHSGTVGGV